MSVWSAYEARLGGGGRCLKRDSELDHIQARMNRKIPKSLSYKNVKINGVDVSMAIIDDENDFSKKKIFSLPGKDIPHGAIVEWSDAVWLITERNAHDEFCTQGKMRQCNYLLKWVDDNGHIISRWCVVEDGTKYLIGEKNSELMSIGDARIAITIGKDEDTNKLQRGMRFLIDDMDSDDILAYQITKPNKLFNVYGGHGVFRFILNEVNLTDNDNCELRIADYYNWEPHEDRPKPDVQTGDPIDEIVKDAIDKKEQEDSEDDRKVWL